MEITLTMQIEGPEAGAMLRRLQVELNQAMASLAPRTYSPHIDAFRLWLCVSGEFTTFEEPSGPVGYRLEKKKREAAAKIVMQEDIWRAGEERTRTFLHASVREALGELCARVRMGKLEIDEERLLADVDAALGDVSQ